MHIGLRARGWPESEVAALNAAQIAGSTVDQIRDLVRKLVEARNIRQPQAHGVTINENPKLVAGREKYWADVRAGIRPHPRSKKGVQL